MCLLLFYLSLYQYNEMCYLVLARVACDFRTRIGLVSYSGLIHYGIGHER